MSHRIYRVETFQIEAPYILRVRFDDRLEQRIHFHQNKAFCIRLRSKSEWIERLVPLKSVRKIIVNQRHMICNSSARHVVRGRADKTPSEGDRSTTEMAARRSDASGCRGVS
jgi:hypothetical protein